MSSRRGSDTPNRIRNQYGRFAAIPQVLVRDSSVSDRAVRLYALLWTYSDERDREAWPSRKDMAEVLGVSLDTIDRGVKELAERGAISVESAFDGPRQTSNVYTILTLPNDDEHSNEVIHRGRKYAAGGAANMRLSGAANMRLQEQEPDEQEVSPVPQVTHDATGPVETGTGPDSSAPTPKLLSHTIGKPLQHADVFAAVGRQLPDTFTDAMLDILAGEILAKASTRVVDPTGYVIRTLRARDLVDRGQWFIRADTIARDHSDREAGF